MSHRDRFGTTSDDTPAASGVYDWSTTDPARAVVETVASAAGRDETDLPMLYESVDPDGLNALVRSGARTGVAVSFLMGGYDVTVHGDGRVNVRGTAHE